MDAVAERRELHNRISDLLAKPRRDNLMRVGRPPGNVDGGGGP